MVDAGIDRSVVLISIISPIVVATILGTIAYIKKKIGCIDKIDQRTLRQSQAMIVLGNHISPDVGLEIEKLLKDEYGNL
jgi:hypothetical protein